MRVGRFVATVVAAITLAGAGCASTAECPRTVEQLHDPALRARIGGDFVAGVAIVNRYIDSPDARFRGYDLEITVRVAGLGEADQVMFASAQDPIENVEPGDEVIVVGRRGPGAAEIQPAGCPVLAPIGSP